LKPTENSKKIVTLSDGSANVEYGRFTAVADLKPVFLDKEATVVEINQEGAFSKLQHRRDKWCSLYFVESFLIHSNFASNTNCICSLIKLI
jgi:hypothetical protein